jgi:hypothetical protein
MKRRNLSTKSANMKTNQRLFTLVFCALFLGSGCLSPRFKSTSIAPPGRGQVYIYSLKDVPVGNGLPGGGGLNHLTHNNAKLADLGPKQYLVHFPEPGTNTYGFHMTWASRGGLLGRMFLNQQDDPTPTLLSIELGKTYYFRTTGGGLHVSFLRMDEYTALQELLQCRRVKTEKAKQQ